MRASRTLAAFGLGLALGLVLLASARAYIRIEVNGRQLHWSAPEVTWNLQLAGSEDLLDGSHVFAIQHAFAEWEALSGSKFVLPQGPDVTVGPETNAHVVMFDETNATGYFPQSSGIVALTPISYDLGSGVILDADIVFNGRDYTWSVTGAPNTFDVQDVITHEIGHFIGLDHSPSITGTMWPYVSFNQDLHRSLSLDDRSGAISIAPMGNQSTLTGIVRRAGAPVPGAIVHAIRVDDGRHIANALCDEDGVFQIRGLPATDYHVYAAPLEGGMNATNLTGNSAVSTAFAPAFLGGFSTPAVFNVTNGNTTNVGNLNVPANRALLESNSSPMRLWRGDSRLVTVYGSGFETGLKSFVVKSPFLTVTQVESGTSFARGIVTVGPGAPFGAYDVYVRDSSGFFEAASALIEVVAEAPLLSQISISAGNAAGGEQLTFTGLGFQEGCAVLFGGFEAAAVEFPSDTQLTVTTPVTSPGDVDVSVHNPDGQFDVLSGAFSFTAQPIYQRIFPQAGHTDGGTTVLINGASFAPGITVFLDSEELAVEWISSQLLRVTTLAHLEESVDLLLRNPGEPDTVIAGAFTFMTTPDPRILSFTPSKGPRGGGTRVAISGFDLGEISEVRFGANALTALGGKPATAMNVVSAGRVEATTQSQSAPGVYGILVRTATGQGAFASGFTFEGDGSTNPGGSGFDLPSAGGCGGVIGGGPMDARSSIGELLGFGLLYGVWMTLRRRVRSAIHATAE